MRIVLASSERFAGCLADCLVRSGHEVAAVLSPARGLYARRFAGSRFLFYRLRGWDVVAWCRRRRIEVRVSRDLGEGATHRFLRELRADLLVLFSWPTRVTAATRAVFTHGALNIHPSLLPKLRGADPLFSLIDEDLPHFGLSFHKVVDELDAGPIYLQVPLHRRSEDSYDTLYLEVLEGAHRFLPAALDALRTNPAGSPQVGQPTVVSAFRLEMTVLDPEAPLAAIRRRALACCSHHPLVTASDGRLLELFSLRVLSRSAPAPGTERMIVGIGAFSLDVVLEGKVVRLGGVRVAGKPAWATPLLLQLDFRKGHRLEGVETVTRLLARSRRVSPGRTPWFCGA